jgi:HEPN domain-containing protein
MTKRSPLWGNFVSYADWDLLSFAWLYEGGLRVSSFYHATQAVEKYLKALTLSVHDPDGISQTALNNRQIWTHDLEELAEMCAGQFPFYGQPDILARLKRFSEFDQVARYPWTQQKHGNGFTTADLPLFWELIQHLRTDLPIKLDDYILGMLVRGHHHGRPELKANPYSMAELGAGVAALRHVFPDVDKIVRR